MGQNKAFIKVDGLPIIERILSLFKQVFEETVIITSDPQPYGYLDIPLYADILPGLGALGGLYTGLFYGSFDHAFCVACDMPFLKEPLIRFLASSLDSNDVVVPRTSDGLQPLHAVYSKRCLEPIQTLLKDKGAKIIDLYPLVNVRIVEETEILPLDPLKESFTNINTPEDLLRIHKARQWP